MDNESISPQEHQTANTLVAAIILGLPIDTCSKGLQRITARRVLALLDHTEDAQQRARQILDTTHADDAPNLQDAITADLAVSGFIEGKPLPDSMPPAIQALVAKKTLNLLHYADDGRRRAQKILS